MVTSFTQSRKRVVPGAPGVPSAVPSPSTIMPYDYAAKFELRGQPGNVVQDVINVSTESIFIAVAIGYGFEEERGRPVSLALTARDTLPGLLRPADVLLGEIPIAALIEGFRTNPRFDYAVFTTELDNGTGVPRAGAELSEQELSVEFFTDVDQRGRDLIFQRLKSPKEISFLFSIVDSGSGRELQDEPTHNLASLGKSNGERPFRPLAQPVYFMPRSTIRLQIVEQSEGTRGTLFIVFYGYKILSAKGCPEPLVRGLRGSPACPTETIGSPSARVIPFDYVTTFDLTGRATNLVTDEISVNVEGGFVATAIGYGLRAEDQRIQIQAEAEDGDVEGVLTDERSTPIPGVTFTFRNVKTRETVDAKETDANGTYSIDELAPGEYEVFLKKIGAAEVPFEARRPAGRIRVLGGVTSTADVTLSTSGQLEVDIARIDLSELPLRLFPAGALRNGVHVRPNFLRIAFQDNGQLAENFPANLVNEAFESLNRPEDVSFRYTIFDTGTGQELQNQPIHNIAGLGIANGDRPFKRFARPMIFLPRATIRVTVEERFGRGKLFLVFQGYKFLGALQGGRS